MITEELTGDAFVDLGRQAILRLAGKTVVDDEELRRMVASQAQLYVHDWAAKLNAFYLNSSITQTQGVYATSEGKLAKTRGIFDAAFTQAPDGYCEICGRHAHIVRGDRTNFPLAGSGTEVNFHPSLMPGIDLCPECLAAVFFLPVAVLQAAGKPLALQARTQRGYDAWLHSTVDVFRDAAAKGLSKGPVKAREATLPNVIYAAAVRFVQSAAEEEVAKEQFTFFSFTNFGSGPEANIVVLPPGLLLYLCHVEKHTGEAHAPGGNLTVTASPVTGSTVDLKKVLAIYPELNEAWHAFLRRGIRRGKQQKGQGPVPEDDPLLNRNDYIARLVQGKSLLRTMREAGVGYKLAALYEMEVRGMEQQRMQKLMDVGERLADFERQQSDLRIVRDLERSETSSDLRAVLRQAARRHAEVSGTPLMTATDLAQWIVPDSARWDETRDFLLVYLYEELADMLKKKGASREDEQAEVDMVADNEEEERNE